MSIEQEQYNNIIHKHSTLRMYGTHNPRPRMKTTITYTNTTLQNESNDCNVWMYESMNSV